MTESGHDNWPTSDHDNRWKQWFAHGRSTGGLFSLLLIVVPFPVVSRWWNGERTIDLAQTLIVHGTSFCVEPQRSCPRRRTALHGLGLRMANGYKPTVGSERWFRCARSAQADALASR